jgi:hypothetical protein
MTRYAATLAALLLPAAFAHGQGCYGGGGFSASQQLTVPPSFGGAQQQYAPQGYGAPAQWGGGQQFAPPFPRRVPVNVILQTPDGRQFVKQFTVDQYDPPMPYGGGYGGGGPPPWGAPTIQEGQPFLTQQQSYGGGSYGGYANGNGGGYGGGTIPYGTALPLAGGGRVVCGPGGCRVVP